MALQLKTVENTAFDWAWEEDPEVRCKLLPATRRIERRAAKASGLEMGIDGSSKVWQQAEHLVILAQAVTEEWEGIKGPDGASLPVTRENVEWIFEQAPGLVLAIVTAAREKYAEVQDLAGKSETPPSGTSRESTAKPASSRGNSSSSANVKLVDVG